MHAFSGFYVITRVIDGDSIQVRHTLSKQLVEVRLYGIDAPEIKKCRKLLQDERESHLAGGLLMHLGKMSAAYLRKIAPVGAKASLRQEPGSTLDMYGRTLAYVYLADGTCVNEAMVKAGYAKAFTKYFCEDLKVYQQLNTFAMQSRSGLYHHIKFF